MEKKIEPMRIRSHTFKERSDYGYTYEITFNRSLEHTGRMDAMTRGIDRFDRYRKAWYLIHSMIARPLALMNFKWTKAFYHYTNNRF